MKLNHAERVVIVDDDIVTRYLIGSALKESNFETYECDTAESLFSLLDEQRVDVIILDLVLPNIDGLSALTYLRKDSDVGVIMISSRANKEHRLDGLKEGADDFLSKPVDTNELIFKARSLAARVRSQRGYISSDNIRVGNCEIFPNDSILKHSFQENSCPLTESEQRILILLSQNKNQTCSRKTLHQSISRAEVTTSNMRSIDTLISRIRKKLDDLSCNVQILSVRGQGYRLIDES